MSELEEVADTLEELEKKETEYNKRKAGLDRKDAAGQVNSLQDLIIRYQRQAINTLMRILSERDAMSKQWETFSENVINCRIALTETRGAVSDAKNKREVDLESQSSSLKKELANREEDIRILTKRIKLLQGDN